MSERVIVHEATSQIEAEGLRAWLEGEGIACHLDDPRDTAYPGIVDRGRPFRVWVRAGDRSAAENATKAWLTATTLSDGPYRHVESEEPALGPTAGQLARQRFARSATWALLAVASVGANFYLYLDRMALEREAAAACDTLGANAAELALCR